MDGDAGLIPALHLFHPPPQRSVGHDVVNMVCFVFGFMLSVRVLSVDTGG